MATLTIRNLPPEVHDGLRRRAAENKRSVEAEVREMLRQGVVGGDEMDRERALDELEAMGAAARRAAPDGWSFTDQYLAERRLEAAADDGRVSVGERLDWEDRLARYVSTPAELERFIQERTASA